MMKIISLPRRAGKTTQLIRMSAETGCSIVTANRYMARQIEKLAADMGVDIPEPFFIARKQFRMFDEDGILIDELDSTLRSVFGVDVLAATVTEQEHGHTCTNCGAKVVEQ